MINEHIEDLNLANQTSHTTSANAAPFTTKLSKSTNPDMEASLRPRRMDLALAKEIMKYTILLLSLVLTISASAKGLTQETINELPPKKIEKALPNEHPSAYYLYASRLFFEEKKQEAVLWFYIGQIRFRAHLMSNPDLEPSGDPALFSSLNATVGQLINEYAGGDPDEWAEQMKGALVWDEKHKNGFTSKKKNKEVYEQTRKGLEGLIANIKLQADQIREKRKASGLENRG